MLLGATQYHVGLRIDTVGVWGSNPHAPTNFLSKNGIVNLTLEEIRLAPQADDSSFRHLIN